MPSTDISKPLRFLNPGPLDSLWGPYVNLAAACAAIPNEAKDVDGVLVNLREGKKVGIKTPIGIFEYYWRLSYSDAGLVPFDDNAKSDSVIKADVNQLLDKSALVAGSSWSNATGAIAANASYKRTPLIELEKNTQYTISGVSVEFLGGLYNAAGVRQNKLNEPGALKLSELTFVTGTDNNYLGLNISGIENSSPGIYDNTALVSKGTNKTYYPYRGFVLDATKLLGDILGYVKSASFDAVSVALAANILILDGVTQPGVQLLDKSLIISGSSWSNGGNPIILSPAAGYKRYPLIRLKPNTTYTVSGAKTIFFGGLYNSSGTARSVKLNEPFSVAASTITFTTGSEAVGNYLGLNVSSEEATTPNAADNTVMLAEGLVKEYEPYKNKVIRGDRIDGLIQGINLPLLKTTLDSQKLVLDFLLKEYDVYYKFDGTAYYNLPSSITLDAIGDYMEIEASSGGTPPNNGLGLIGGPNNPNPVNKFGYWNGTQVALRGSGGGNYLLWTVPGSISDIKKYRLEVVAGGWQLSVDGVAISTQAKTSSLVLTNLGSTYSSGNFIGNVRSLKLHNATNDLSIADFKTGGINVQQISVKKAEASLASASLADVYVSYDPTGYAQQQGQGVSGKERFLIYVKIPGTIYYQGTEVSHIVDLSGMRADLYRVITSRLYKYSEGAMVDQGKPFLTLGDSEGVYRENGKSDDTLGFHGDEILDAVYFYIDGIQLTSVDLQTAFTMRPANQFSYEMLSRSLETDNATLVYSMKRTKRNVFEKGHYRVRTGLLGLRTISMNVLYLGIACTTVLCAKRYSSELLNYNTNTGSGNYLNEPGATNFKGFNDTERLACEVESRLLKSRTLGVDSVASYNYAAQMVITETPERSKFYRSIKNFTFNAGDYIEFEQVVTFRKY